MTQLETRLDHLRGWADRLRDEACRWASAPPATWEDSEIVEVLFPLLPGTWGDWDTFEQLQHEYENSIALKFEALGVARDSPLFDACNRALELLHWLIGVSLERRGGFVSGIVVDPADLTDGEEPRNGGISRRKTLSAGESLLPPEANERVERAARVCRTAEQSLHRHIHELEATQRLSPAAALRKGRYARVVEAGEAIRKEAARKKRPVPSIHEIANELTSFGGKKFDGFERDTIRQILSGYGPAEKLGVHGLDNLG